MPPVLKQQDGGSDPTTLLSQGWSAFKDHKYTAMFAMLFVVGELILNIAVVHIVPYTEIDWQAYMSEVEGVVNGSYDYTKLEGGTGPLVYPAGFVYFFLGLYHVTNNGEDIFFAQHIFAVFYCINLALVAVIYTKTKMPPYLLAWLCATSYRIHSIFVLRLFNDPIAMIFLHAAVILFVAKRWTIGCVLFSLAVSIKMNILMFAPGLGMLLMLHTGFRKTIMLVGLCGIIQVLLGAPFLLENTPGYMNRAFNLGRQFQYKWTVNWKFLDEDVFLNRTFHLVLLAGHLLLLCMFAAYKWTKLGPKVVTLLTGPPDGQTRNFSATQIVSILFASNFIGMAFARSLHYQFYVWYFYSLPWLLWQTKLPVCLRIILLMSIEVCWNVYPATAWSSGLLHLCHAGFIAALWVAPQLDGPPPPKSEVMKKKD